MFDDIIYINLEHRKDREKNVLTQLKKIKNSKIHKINAIYGNKLVMENISEKLINKKGKDDAFNNNLPVGIPLTKGAIGCALSHREAYIYIIKNNLNAALIIEDDITIDDNFMEKINELNDNKPNTYDIIYLGYHNATNKYIYINYDKFSKAYIVYGLFGYIVTYIGAQKLLDIFPINKQIDTEISLHFDKINAFIVNPNNRIIFSEESNIYSKFGTDIQIREKFTNDIHLCKKIKNNYKIIFFIIILTILIYLVFNCSSK